MREWLFVNRFFIFAFLIFSLLFLSGCVKNNDGVIIIENVSTQASPISACGTISSSGQYYLTQDLTSSGTCITMGTSNIELDCQGYTITHNGSGIYTNGKTNITIKNCNIIGSNSGYGIHSSSGSSSIYIFNNSIKSNNYGIFIDTSGGASIINNSITSNSIGINFFWISSSSNIYNNFFNNSQNIQTGSDTNNWNTSLDCSSGSNIINGSCIGGNYWATPSGTGFSQHCLDIDLNGICDNSYTIATNNIDYLPLRLTIPISSCGTYTQGYAVYYITSNITSSTPCINITSSYNYLYGQNYTITGISVKASHNTIDNVSIYSANIEFPVTDLQNLTVRNSYFTGLSGYGRYVFFTGGWNNYRSGIYVYNNFFNSTSQIEAAVNVYYGRQYLSNVNIYNNTMIGLYYYAITFYETKNGYIYNNTFNVTGATGAAIRITSNNDVRIYNNYILENISSSIVSGVKLNTTLNCSTGYTNIIGGECIGGNYWAKHNGMGHSQTCSEANCDGICDTSYTNGGTDYLPLTYYQPATVLKINNGTDFINYNSTNTMKFRCSNPPTICEPLNQNSTNNIEIIRNMNNCSYKNTTMLQIYANTSWGSDATLKCGLNNSLADAYTITTTPLNITRDLPLNTNETIFCWLNITSVGPEFPRLFNLTIINR